MKTAVWECTILKRDLQLYRDSALENPVYEWVFKITIFEGATVHRLERIVVIAVVVVVAT